MNLKQMLNLADKIVFEKTGQHLDDLQEAILQGTLQNKTYKQIAKDLECSESRVRNAASQLWQLLSQESGEDISKNNFRSAMERLQISIFSKNFALQQDCVQISCCVNSYGEAKHPPDIPNSHPENKETSNSKQPQTPHHDLSEMPELGTFYDRTPELETLTTWILQQQCRLILLTGITGIGKTSLAVKLVQQIKQEFDYILWHTINPSDTLNELQHQLTQLFTPSENLPLIKYFQKHRILIILDDSHNLFSPGELAGKYQPQ